jgi:hypothetical protein
MIDLTPVFLRAMSRSKWWREKVWDVLSSLANAVSGSQINWDPMNEMWGGIVKDGQGIACVHSLRRIVIVLPLLRERAQQLSAEIPFELIVVPNFSDTAYRVDKTILERLSGRCLTNDPVIHNFDHLSIYDIWYAGIESVGSESCSWEYGKSTMNDLTPAFVRALSQPQWSYERAWQVLKSLANALPGSRVSWQPGDEAWGVVANNDAGAYVHGTWPIVIVMPMLEQYAQQLSAEIPFELIVVPNFSDTAYRVDKSILECLSNKSLSDDPTIIDYDYISIEDIWYAGT